MDDDSQPRIAILGAGPIGLEAALYARYLGYPVEIFERSAHPAANVLAHGEKRLSAPFGESASTLGLAALRAQNPDWLCPAATELLTAVEWYQSYLLPVAESDLVAEVLRFGAEVIEITRGDDAIFQIRYRDSQFDETTHMADIVIDAMGRDSNRHWYSDPSDNDDFDFLNPESDFYVLGSKSHPTGNLTFIQGLAQIRDLFAILGEREDLDVYTTMPAVR